MARHVVSPANNPPSLTQLCVIVPAHNEQHTVGSVVQSIRLHLPGAAVVVVDDGSDDATADLAVAAGATILSLPFNLGIGGAVQTGYRFAVTNGFRFAMQIDADGQHDAAEAVLLLGPAFLDNADVVLGSRWMGRGDYQAPPLRRIGMLTLSKLVKMRTGQVITDTTSGFRVLGPRALTLFARSYPTDFPEVESLVQATRAKLTIREVAVIMHYRSHGRSAVAGITSAYYMARVALALLLGGRTTRGAK